MKANEENVGKSKKKWVKGHMLPNNYNQISLVSFIATTNFLYLFQKFIPQLKSLEETINGIVEVCLSREVSV